MAITITILILIGLVYLWYQQRKKKQIDLQKQEEIVNKERSKAKHYESKVKKALKSRGGL